MNAKYRNQVLQAAVIFLALGAAYFVLVMIAQNTVSAFDQSLLISAGSILFGSGLTFFLVRTFSLKDR